uniref:Uncharacterized protein n=1 Tax=Tanacetum cinerariifolium TaxID=118510 RepID=A0A6L2LKN0_TANCI|nr:hypothetical protein [Tanacetum cinerariifolium]
MEDHTSDCLRVVPISGLGQTMNGRTYRIYGDHVMSCVSIVGIKHRHNIVRDTLVVRCFWSRISAGKEVDIGLSDGRDKTLHPADMMADFVPGRAVIDATKCKHVKYEAKCTNIGYGFLPFSFSSIRELEEDAITLLKRIRKFSVAQDIGTRAAVHIFNRATTKVKKVNDQEQIQALVDKTKVIIMENSIRSDLRFDDVEGTACLINEEIFEGLARMGAKTTACNEFNSTMASAIICLADNQKLNFSKYIFDNMVKRLEGGVKFYLFLRFLQVFLDKQIEGMARYKELCIISSHTKKIFANMRRIGAGFSGKKQQSRKKQRMEAEVSHDKSEDEDHVLTPSSDPLPSGLGRLKKFGSVRRVKSSMEKDDLGAQEDASKQRRMIEEIDQNADIALDDETQGRTNDDEMFRVDDLEGEEVVMETTTGVKDSAAPTTDVTKDEVTMAQALDALKSTKPKVVVQEQEMSATIPAAATIVTTAVPTLRAKGIIFHEQKQSQIPTVSSSKDKGKAKMIEPEVPFKRKEQMRIDEEYARMLEAEEQETTRLSRAQQDEEANNSWDNMEAMMDADRLLAEKLQAREKEEFFEVKKARLLDELIEKKETLCCLESSREEKQTTHQN